MSQVLITQDLISLTMHSGTSVLGNFLFQANLSQDAVLAKAQSGAVHLNPFILVNYSTIMG